MNTPIITWLAEHYHWQLSLITFVAVVGGPLLLAPLVRLIPVFKDAEQTNRTTFNKKMEKPVYAANQKLNRKWGLIDQVVIFALIIPFCLTLDPQPLWKMALDVFVILMVYDFFYYLVHRFLFHDAGFLGGPLVWVHAVHHQQHNPCRMDSSYIHPLEVMMGLGLYVATIFGLSLVMGQFHVVTIIITWIAFQQINLHNHDLWKTDRFPFKYLNYVSVMHHHHHAKFIGGNFATISLLYDWMFGTLDHGGGNPKVLKKG
jgi:sterol desaturase/sphingolipid hydroxylase (fatty acid hydroxylase superfamily)